MTQTAKLFKNGRSQAVRLPAEFRFDGEEVFINRDSITGDVILSTKPKDWDDLFNMIKISPAKKDFLSKEERIQTTTNKDPFSGWQE